MRAPRLLIMLAMPVAIGCGGGDTPQKAGAAATAASSSALPPVDACTIVSKAEVEAAVGKAVDSTGPGAAGFAGTACNFYGKTIDDLVGIAVANQAVTGIESSAALAAFFSDTAEHGMFAVDAKPVEGLGVPAAQFKMGWTVVSAIGKGPRRVDVTSPSEAVSRALITKVLARLP